MKRYFLVVLAGLLVSINSFAEVKEDGKWHFPTSIKTMCMGTEQTIVAMYKAMIENNREMIDKKGEDNRERSQLSEHYKQSIITDEESWQRLGCASILYGK